MRCAGCWLYENPELLTKDERDLVVLRAFITKERERGINVAQITGGEPTLYPNRIAEYVAQMDYVTISTNGMKKLPY